MYRLRVGPLRRPTTPSLPRGVTMRSRSSRNPRSSRSLSDLDQQTKGVLLSKADNGTGKTRGKRKVAPRLRGEGEGRGVLRLAGKDGGGERSGDSSQRNPAVQHVSALLGTHVFFSLFRGIFTMRGASWCRGPEHRKFPFSVYRRPSPSFLGRVFKNLAQLIALASAVPCVALSCPRWADLRR